MLVVDGEVGFTGGMNIGNRHLAARRGGCQDVHFAVTGPVVRELERLFADSTTLGVRIMEVERVTARRWPETIETPYGPLQVKVMEYGGRRRLLPEYEACRRMAQEQGLPLMEIYRLVPRE